MNSKRDTRQRRWTTGVKGWKFSRIPVFVVVVWKKDPYQFSSFSLLFVPVVFSFFGLDFLSNSVCLVSMKEFSELWIMGHKTCKLSLVYMYIALYGNVNLLVGFAYMWEI